MERYHRHLMLEQIGEEGQQKLLNSSVLIVGVGGLGSAISLYLAAAGVGRIGIIDADTVSESNLQRQVLYTENEVGQPKVVCAKARLQKLASHITIDTFYERLDERNVQKLISDYDLVVDGCDNYSTRYLINDWCLKLKKTYVYGTIGEFTGQVSVFNYQGGWNYRDLYPDEAYLASLPLKISGVMGILPGVIGCMQAGEVIKVITGAGKTLTNRLYTIDLLNFNTDIIEF